MFYLCSLLGVLWWHALYFKSLSHFEFILCMVCSNFTDLYAAVQLPSNTCWRVCLFSIVYSCLLCQKLIDHRCAGLSWTLYFVQLIYISAFVPVAYCFDECSFEYSLKSWRLIPPAPFFFLKIALAIHIVSIQTVKFFVLDLWKMPLVIW